MTTRFVLRSDIPEITQKLIAQGYPRALARALSARGIVDAQDLSENWTDLLAPSQFNHIRKAATFLADAREKHSPIIIVADYDCDGATACAIALRGLRAMGFEVTYVVPDRFRLGYGLSPDVVDLCLQSTPRPEIIITVDNGIASLDGVDYAKKLGLSVIITDHHLAGKSLPKADCIVNPNMPGESFASKSLAGCGVMYYVLLALRAELRNRGVYDKYTQPRLDTLCDLVALGTIADVVKLDKNNRILVSQGLRRIREGRAALGINALLRTAKKDPCRATARDLAFSVAPRINAAGRMTDMQLGIECLMTVDESEAIRLASQLDALNTDRRELEDSMQLDAMALVAGLDLTKLNAVTLFDERWQQGVVGLVASRVKEKINRPVIAFAPDDEETLKGSGRSIDDIHLRDALETLSTRVPDLILRFGGHAMAAGLTIRKVDLERFTREFDALIGEMHPSPTFEKNVLVDGPLKAEEITFGLIETLDREIWGQGFEAPLFANDFTVISQRLLKDAHLKLWLELDGKRFDAIFFRHRESLPTHVRLAYRPDINTFMGRRSIQLVVSDAELS